jgi:hypothetical protein
MTDDFNTLHQNVESLCWSLRKHEGLHSNIRHAKSLIGTNWHNYTDKKKNEIAESLDEAERCLDALRATADVRAEIAHIRGLLAAASPYVPKPAPAPEVEEKTNKVLRKYGIDSDRWGVVECETRIYDDSDPRGKYQKWEQEKFVRTMTEEEAVNEPFPRSAKWTMSEEECKKAGLQARLGELKLLCTAELCE